MNVPAAPRYCGCKMLGTRWASPCPSHLHKYIEFSGMVPRYYEQMRRQQTEPTQRSAS